MGSAGVWWWAEVGGGVLRPLPPLSFGFFSGRGLKTQLLAA